MFQNAPERTLSLLSTPRKKFSENLLHFLHPGWETPIKPCNFGCRMGCRISPWGRKILHLPPFSSPLSPYFRIGTYRKCAVPCQMLGGKCQKTVPKHAESYTNPTSYTLSYTPSFTRNCQVLLGFPIPGVGNVGDFQKTFFMGGRKNVETASTRRRTGIPKHRTSLGKSTEVLP